MNLGIPREQNTYHNQIYTQYKYKKLYVQTVRLKTLAVRLITVAGINLDKFNESVYIIQYK